MKKVIYISLFTLLGVLLQFLAHMALEIWYIKLLLSNFQKFGFGFSWDFWVASHNVLAIIFLLVGAGAGFYFSKYFYKKIYENSQNK